VSDPDSARYGEHFSIEDTHALMAPSPDALAAVNDWLVSHGFDIHDLQRSPAMDWVKLNATVQKVEEMLNTVRLFLLWFLLIQRCYLDLSRLETLCNWRFRRSYN